MSATQIAFDCLECLKQAGVMHVGIAPGSRSTPLVVSAEVLFRDHLRVHYDERGLGFWGVGIGKSTGIPVVLIVTSGTAVANLLPAVIEAYYSSTPLIVLTADRPFELVGVGSNQAIDQARMLAPYCRFSADLHPPQSALEEGAWLSSVMAAVANVDRGPVHLNMRFRDPLWQETELICTRGYRHSLVKKAAMMPVSVAPIDHGLVVIGELGVRDSVQDIVAHFAQLGVPVIVDGISIATVAPHPLVGQMGEWYPDDLISSPVDTLVHIGGKLLSKSMNAWISKFEGRYIQVTDSEDRTDPHHHSKEWVIGPIDDCARAMTFNSAAKVPIAQYEAHISRHSEWFQTQWSELSAMAYLQSELSQEWMVFVGNSLPIRLWNMSRGFSQHPYRGITNRGASGIDGLVATMAGAAEGSGRKTMGIIGDISALHDLNSIGLLGGLAHSVTIIFNNDGGGIFRYLPIRDYAAHQSLFRVTHGLNFSHVAALFGRHYQMAETQADSVRAIQTAMNTPGNWIIELQFDPERTRRHIQQIRETLW